MDTHAVLANGETIEFAQEQRGKDEAAFGYAPCGLLLAPYMKGYVEEVARQYSKEAAARVYCQYGIDIHRIAAFLKHKSFSISDTQSILLRASRNCTNQKVLVTALGIVFGKESVVGQSRISDSEIIRELILYIFNT